MLLVGVVRSADETITGITYDGVAMTAVPSSSASNGGVDGLEWYRLIDPATGSNDVVVSFSADVGPDAVTSVALSYTGVNQTTPITVVATSTNKDTASITTGVANEYLVQLIGGDGFTLSAYTDSQVQRETDTSGPGVYLADRKVTTAGAYNMRWSTTGGNYCTSILALQPIEITASVDDTITTSDGIEGLRTRLANTTDTVNVSDDIDSELKENVWLNPDKSADSGWTNPDKS